MESNKKLNKDHLYLIEQQERTLSRLIDRLKEDDDFMTELKESECGRGDSTLKYLIASRSFLNLIINNQR